MKGKTLNYIILLATISIAGVFLIQFAFLRSSYRFSEKQFRESASVALKEVAWQIMLATGTTSNFDSITPVEVVSNNSFVVNVGTRIDKELLQAHLEDELKKHEIFYDFEFAIYNPVSEQMDEGTLVRKGAGDQVSCYIFPINDDYTYYFSIHFPDRTTYFNSRLSIWYFLTGLLVLIVLFFGYTLSIIIKQRQLSEIQKNFINNLTHELKTPISSIALSANVINDEKIVGSPKRLLKYARIIQEQNTRLSNNVEKVLNLASLEKNRIHLKLEPTDLKEILQKITRHFKQSDPGRQAKVEIRLNGAKPTIAIDRFHFTNLVENILENAVKYSDKKPEILIELVATKKHYELSFTDNGIGIPKEHRKKIFKKFYRIPTGNVHNVKGFGLGLDYVHKIVNAHKWKIRVDENPKGGSIFTITIPN